MTYATDIPAPPIHVTHELTVGDTITDAVIGHIGRYEIRAIELYSGRPIYRYVSGSYDFIDDADRNLASGRYVLVAGPSMPEPPRVTYTITIEQFGHGTRFDLQIPNGVRTILEGIRGATFKVNYEDGNPRPHLGSKSFTVGPRF